MSFIYHLNQSCKTSLFESMQEVNFQKEQNLRANQSLQLCFIRQDVCGPIDPSFFDDNKYALYFYFIFEICLG